ncbi:MAG: hypothetical protein ABSC48_02355 [Terracidiphilus sp.]|jgi:hypothetical protein
MDGDVLGREQIQERQSRLAGPNLRLKQARPAVLVIAASFLLMGQTSRTNTAEAQYVTFNEKVPQTSGCYKPELYDHGVNMAIKVWSNSLTAEDLRPLGISPSKGPESIFEGIPEVQLPKLVAKDLSRLKDTGIVVDNALPRDASGKIPIHFQVQINLDSEKLISGEVTGYVASVHIAEICSAWGEGKDLGMSIREVDVPGILRLSTINEMVRNLDDWVYDAVMDVVKARRQSTGAANSKNKQAVPEKKP